MSQKRISFRLNSHVTAFAVLIIAMVVYLNFHFSKKILIGKIEEGAVNQSNLVISRISRITVGAEEIARNVSYQALYYRKHNDLDLFLKGVTAANPILESLHVEFNAEIGQQFVACNSGSCCEQRCSESNEIYPEESDTLTGGVWSKPFSCANDSSSPLISYRYPVFRPESKEIMGFVFCEISLQKMSQMLSGITINHNGYAFIIDKSGNYIAHPNEKWILKRNIFSNPDFIPENKQAFEEQISQEKNGAQYGLSNFYADKKAWFYAAHLANTNWIAVVVISEAELFKEIHLIFEKILWVCGLGILVLFVFNMLIFRRILTPLADVAEAIHEFASVPGDEKETKDEIKILKDSLESWQEKYGSLMKEKSQNEVERTKFERALKSAREIQQNIVPEGKASFPEHPEIDLYATLLPADKVGGDLYDYFFIDKTHLLIAIGDVSGKGIPASLFMAVASTLIKASARILSAKEIVAEVNRELSNRNSDQYFLTLFVGVLDIETGLLDFCNAAHNYPYILKSDSTIQALSKSHGLPLGLYRNKTYKSSTAGLAFADTLVLYTDGVINATNEKGQYYGTDRLERNLLNINGLSSEELVAQLLGTITIFKGDNAQSDDISILALKYRKQV